MSVKDVRDTRAIIDALPLAAARWKQRQQAAEHAETRARLSGPTNIVELARAAYELTGLRVSPRAVCPGHVSPLQALSDAYFAQNSMTVWKASRGLGGKSVLLALLGHLEMIYLGTEVVILGGSGQQSQRVHDTQSAFWKYPAAPAAMLSREPTQYETWLTNGGHSVALLASTRSARGPHPTRLRMDETDEMDIKILDAALGQTMMQKGVPAQTVLSSTHQYPDGTMSEILKRAKSRGWGVYEWCVAADTMVAVPCGLRRIDSLRAGDAVYAYDAQRKRYVETAITAAWSNGVKQTVKVETTHGTIECTPEHKLLTPTGWKEAQNLSHGEAVYAMRARVVARDERRLVPLVLHGRAGHARRKGDAVRVRECLAARCDEVSRLLQGARGPDSHVPTVPRSQGARIGVMSALLSQDAPGAQHAPARRDDACTGDRAQRVASFIARSESGRTVQGARDSLRDELGSRSLRVRFLPPRLSCNSRGVRALSSRRACDNARQRACAFDRNERVYEFRDSLRPRLAHVVAITAGRAVDVWDISVPEYHSFVANGIVAHNCYKENLVGRDGLGWLEDAEVERKRNEVTQQMWDAEYDLQEPSSDDRAIDTAAVERMFSETHGQFPGSLGSEEQYEAPAFAGEYATGCDWAKSKDYLINVTMRTDQFPYRWVAFKRDGRRPWPVMVEDFNERVKAYNNSNAAHDATGIGGVIDDLLTVDAEGLLLQGRTRSTLLSEYIKAIENDEIRAPHVEWAYGEHKYATYKDVYGTGHLPDSLCAGALAYWAFKHGSGRIW